MRSLLFFGVCLVVAEHVVSARFLARRTDSVDSEQHFTKEKRCDSCGYGGGGGGGGDDRRSGGSHRSQAPDLSLKELVQLLPLLSSPQNAVPLSPLQNPGPVAAATITHLPFPPLGPLSAPPNVESMGALIQLAKVLTRRETDQVRTIAEARAYLAKMFGTQKPIRNQNASVPVHKPGQKILDFGQLTGVQFNVSTPVNAGELKPTAGDSYEFEDYGPPPPPVLLAHYIPKGHVGDVCKSDSDCVHGAGCKTVGRGPNARNHCDCRMPFVRSQDRCVPAPDRSA